MLQNDLYYTLALLQVEGVGDILAKKLISQCGSAEAVFKAKKTTLAKIDGIGNSFLKNIQDKTVFHKTDHV